MVAEIELAPVVTLPEPITDRVDSREKSVATDTHLPLHWAGWAAGECYSTRTVVLRAAVCHWRSRTSEVGADIAGVELDGVKSVIHVEPLSMTGSISAIGVSGGVNAAITASQQDAG